MNRLQVLTLSGNDLEGSIPNSLYQLVHMVKLYLDMNALSGPISTSINNLTYLQNLHLNSNSFSSAIPPALCELKNLIWLYLQDNFFTGQLPLEVGNLVVVDKMDISMNQLTGELPVSLSRLQMLEYLNLSKNSFDGHIPEKLDSMVNIQTIDLSHNKLSGEIPKSLENLRQLQILNLSFNQLEGKVPSGGNFASLSTESFVGNDALCGAPKFHLPACLDKKANRTTKVVVGCAIGGPALLLVVCILLVVLDNRKRGMKETDEVERLHGTTLPVISYSQLSHATNNFSDANFLGSGSFGTVYKGILMDGTTVAVKVLNLLSEEASKSFDIECNVMCQIRHRNIVKVITSCSNRDFKALIVQYMPLGSLEACLHSGAHHLNFYQRLDIMLDVACGLEYLHHATLGSTGYIAPEFGTTGKVSTKADVYSYGILLLEVFTGRKPTDERFHGDFSFRQWVVEALPVAISDVTDGHLLKESNGTATERSAAWNDLLVMIMEIGLSCSRESPIVRMDMKEFEHGKQELRPMPQRNKLEVSRPRVSAQGLSTPLKLVPIEEEKKIMPQMEEFEAMVDAVINPNADMETKGTATERPAAWNELLVMMMEIRLSCSRESPIVRMDMKDVVARLKRISQKASSFEKCQKNILYFITD
ncbi:receptor kinase-like protein Xa21 [Nymphaea colorata]|uniref:receptor kinase-like protein Xa21 n=1 Tax=Nymphaea colorata TaxID=210225 RepID=UPI00129E6F7E|nr:receptor kinase-like protein Xa21 [Nymphaea colorata]